MKRAPWSLVAMFVIVGFLLVVTSNATTVASADQEPRKRELISQIGSQRSAVEDLDKAVEQLRDEVAEARRNAGQLSNQQAEQNARIDQLAMEAGTSAVTGSGITVKLSDASTDSGQTSANFDATRIQDNDIQLVVNALFRAGAEAVSINGNRVVAVTPIRAAGGTIVVNFRPVSSPYEVKAIGADKDRFESSEIAGHFEQWEKKFQLGYSVTKHKEIDVPAYSGRVSIDEAQALGSPQ